MLNRILLLLILTTSSWATSYDLTARVDTAKSQAGKLLDLSKVFVDTLRVDTRMDVVALGVTTAATFRDITVDGTSTLDTVLTSVLSVDSLRVVDSLTVAAGAKVYFLNGSAFRAGKLRADTLTSDSLTVPKGARHAYIAAGKVDSLGTDSLTVTGPLKVTGATTFTGTVNATAQPSVIATPSGTLTDVTGDNTVYTVLWASEIKDQGSNFASPTFTAPVTGTYLISASVGLVGTLSTHTSAILTIVTSNRNYRGPGINPYAVSPVGEELTIQITRLVDMDAGDTATITLTVSNGTKVIDIVTSSESYFSAVLLN